MTTPALQRVIRRAGRRERGAPRCELCGEPLEASHRHLLDDHDELRCACRACSLLFRAGGASEGRYRLVTDRRLAMPAFDPSTLGVPVGLAFFVVEDAGACEVLAHYPSPAGATRWPVDPASWRALVGTMPELATIAERTEALLVRTTGKAREAYIVPIDDAFRLVSMVRRAWRGLSGGEGVEAAVEELFAELRRS